MKNILKYILYISTLILNIVAYENKLTVTASVKNIIEVIDYTVNGLIISNNNN